MLILESPKKAQHSQALDGRKILLTWRRDRARSAPVVYWSPMASRLSSWQPAQSHVATPLVQQKDVNPFPVESEILKAEGMPEGHWCSCLVEQRNTHGA